MQIYYRQFFSVVTQGIIDIPGCEIYIIEKECHFTYIASFWLTGYYHNDFMFYVKNMR